MTFPRIKSFHWPQSPGLLSLKQSVYRTKSFTLQLWILSLDPHFHSKWEYNILISTLPDLKMSSLYTGGSGEEDERKREKILSANKQGHGCYYWEREREQHQLPRDALAWDEGLRAGQLGSAGLGKDLWQSAKALIHLWETTLFMLLSLPNLLFSCL